MIKNIFLVIVFLSFSSLNALAYENPTMRSMAAAQLFEYGKALYERGDYPQAAEIISKVLDMDPTHSKAIKIAKTLNQKGEHITLPKEEMIPVEKPKVTVQEAAKSKPAIKKNFAKLPVEVKVPKQEVIKTTPNSDLTQDIQEANEAIKQLKLQVADLRGQISKTSK